MGKARALDSQLSAIAALRDAGSPGAATDLLRKAMASRQNMVVAKAAQVAGELKLAALAPEMEQVFVAMIAGGAKADSGCQAKTSIARAFQGNEWASEAVFLAGITHCQPEPIWGGRTDTACELRGVCAFGLVQMGYARVMPLLVDLLADTAPECRLAAVTALVGTGQPSAELLLRLKLHTGDRDINVLAECLDGLVRLSPGGSIEFIARWLDGPERALVDTAVLALGNSRRAEAVPYLERELNRAVQRSARQITLQALALVRRPEAVDLLVEQVASTSIDAALDAVEALKLYRHDESVRSRVADIAARRNEGRLTAAVRSLLE